MLKYLLDTNIVIYVIKRKPIELLPIFNAKVGQMAISAITFAELIHGVEKSAKPEHNLRQVEDFTSRLEILAYSNKAAAHYGDIRASLERIGKPIGVNDLHIAAHARSEGLTLVSNNIREFERVAGLLLENWVERIGES